jgi:hypothetical protein
MFKDVGDGLIEFDDMAYYKLMGDVCYRYKRISKEEFFNNPYLCGLFLQSAPYLLNHFSQQPKYMEVLNQSLIPYAIRQFNLKHSRILSQDAA